jgi:hypothetical protein
LVAANRADVDVQPEQTGRRRGMGLEYDCGLQAAEPVPTGPISMLSASRANSA